MRIASMLAGFTLATLLASPMEAQLSAASRRQSGRDEITFHLTHFILDLDRAAFVVGDLPELGSNDSLRSIRLMSNDRFNWEATISLPTDRVFSYRFLEGGTDMQDLGDPGNYTQVTPELTGVTRQTRQGPGSKTIQMHTTLREPILHWRQNDGQYRSKRMRLIESGRTQTEVRCGVPYFGLGQRPVEFFVTSGDGSGRDPVDAGETYATSLDEIFLQDGELFSYMPAADVSPARMASTEPLAISSLVLGEERHYRILLPRGYDEHTQRRYPVLYLYDGQFMWSRHPVYDPTYGTWDVDGVRLAKLVSDGLVGEMIVVATEFIEYGDGCDISNSRGRDCISPEDSITDGFCPTVTGRADLFLRFIVEELKPLIDATYRTRPGREHTFASGYSLGGVYAMYAGWEHSDTFGAVAPQSGSFWIPRFTQRILTEPRRDGLRIYLDFGTAEGPLATEPGTAIRDSLVSREPGYVLEGDFRFVLGHGQNHTYTSGGRRMEDMMTFLWPATREANYIPWPVFLH